MGRFDLAAAVAVAMIGSGLAHAADIPVTPTKLIVVDKRARAGKAKAVYVAKDAAVTKGDGLDVEQIGVRLDVAYANGSTTGAFVVPPGTANGWVANKPGVAKYRNPAAPGGPTQVKGAVIRPGKLLKLVAKGVGDTPLDILGAGDPNGAVVTAYCVNNGGEEHCHCAEHTGCTWKAIARGSGAKLVCTTGVGDEACRAVRCTAGLVDLGLTVFDPCTNLEWEKKTTAVGSGADPENLHDVDNLYITAGECMFTGATCQPNAAAVATCLAHTGGAFECGEECGEFDGPCYIGAGITTIWDWVNQLNAAAFAGKQDWRLPTSAGCCEWPTGTAAELESIRAATQGNCAGGVGACIDPIFGPTRAGTYMSGSPSAFVPGGLWVVWFTDTVTPVSGGMPGVSPVRAVRDGS